MFITKLCILLLLSAHLTVSDHCSKSTPCGCEISPNEIIDLSSVGNPQFPRFHDVYFNSTCKKIELYSYNPCYGFESSDKQTVVDTDNKACTNGAAACVKSSGGPTGEFPEEHAIGLQDTATFVLDNSECNISYSMQDESKKKLTVILTCANTTDHTLKMVQPECVDGTHTILNLISKCACINGCLSVHPSTPSGLSTGSKILIAFFTILLAYLLVGVVWNFCNGAQGVELIPNIAVWNELPTLIMEGVIFTCSCFRSSSYGEV